MTAARAQDLTRRYLSDMLVNYLGDYGGVRSLHECQLYLATICRDDRLISMAFNDVQGHGFIGIGADHLVRLTQRTAA